MKSFTDLKTWQKGHSLVLGIYKATSTFPSSEMFGLTSQMRRAAVSITSNLAEGFNRQSFKAKGQFYSIAQASLAELQSQLLIARDINLLDSQTFKHLADQSVEVNKMITGLMKSSRLKALDSRS